MDGFTAFRARHFSCSARLLLPDIAHFRNPRLRSSQPQAQ